MVGNLNARIGQSQVGLIHDDDEVVDDFLLGRERILQDSKSNGFGKRLIRVCDGANVLLLNGIFGGCSGNFTCVKWNGSSVVDFGAIIKNEVGGNNISVSDFSVLQEIECSDHIPISMVCNYKGRHDAAACAGSAHRGSKEIKFANEFSIRNLSEDKLNAVFEADEGGVRTRVGNLVSASTQAFPKGNLRIDSLAGGLAELLVDASLLAGATSTSSGLGGVATQNRTSRRRKIWFDNRLRAEKREVKRIFKSFGKFSNQYKAARDRFRKLCHKKKLESEARLTDIWSL